MLTEQTHICPASCTAGLTAPLLLSCYSRPTALPQPTRPQTPHHVLCTAPCAMLHTSLSGNAILLLPVLISANIITQARRRRLTPPPYPPRRCRLRNIRRQHQHFTACSTRPFPDNAAAAVACTCCCCIQLTKAMFKLLLPGAAGKGLLLLEAASA